MIRHAQVDVSSPEPGVSAPCTPDPCPVVGSTYLGTEHWLCRFSCQRVMKEMSFGENTIVFATQRIRGVSFWPVLLLVMIHPRCLFLCIYIHVCRTKQLIPFHAFSL